jgi:hypothetical protein
MRTKGEFESLDDMATGRRVKNNTPLLKTSRGLQALR